MDIEPSFNSISRSKPRPKSTWKKLLHFCNTSWPKIRQFVASCLSGLGMYSARLPYHSKSANFFIKNRQILPKLIVLFEFGFDCSSQHLGRSHYWYVNIREPSSLVLKSKHAKWWRVTRVALNTGKYGVKVCLMKNGLNILPLDSVVDFIWMASNIIWHLVGSYILNTLVKMLLQTSCCKEAIQIPWKTKILSITGLSALNEIDVSCCLLLGKNIVCNNVSFR